MIRRSGGFYAPPDPVPCYNTKDNQTKPTPMLISEAILHLQPVGVERIDRIANPYGTQTWKVTQNGEEYIYTADLEQMVWALLGEE